MLGISTSRHGGLIELGIFFVVGLKEEHEEEFLV